MPRIICTAAGRAIANTLAIVAASATSAVAVAAETSSAGSSLEEIVVTAQRRAERVQDVPAAITALDGDSLVRLNLQGTESLARQIPSMTFDVLAPGEATITMRGLGTAYGLSPTVSYYFNEVALDTRTDGYSGAPDIDLFDVERIEVLRGPQGTLYGASSMGGAIRILTKQPDFAGFEARSEAGMETTQGAENGWNLKSALNLPVSDQLAARLVGTYQRFGGYVDRATPQSSYLDPQPNDPIAARNINSVDLYSGRLLVKWQPSADLTVTPSVYYQRSDADGTGDYHSNQPRFTVARFYPEPLTSKLLIGNALIETSLGSASLLSSTSYVAKDVDFDHDLSVLPTNLAPAFGITEPFPNFPTAIQDTSENRGFIQEIRVTSDAASRLRWVLGAYYSRYRQRTGEYIQSQAFADAAADVAGEPTPADSSLYTFRQRSQDEQGAIFAELGFDLTSQLELIMGLRGYRLETSLENEQGGLLAAPDQPHTSAKASGVNPRVILNYKPMQDVMLYATAARGYRPGGPNVGLLENAGCVMGDAYRSMYDPDSVWNYEVGAKTQLLDRRATLNLAAYRIEWQDLQQSIADPGCGSLFFANFGTARSDGVEAEFSIRPLESLLLNASASFTDATYKTINDEFLGAASVQPGDALSDVPRWKYALSGEYTFAIGNRWTGYLRSDWQHVGDIPTGVTLQAERPAYDIVNASLGVQSDRYDLSLYVENIGNTAAILAVRQDASSSVPGVFDALVATRPRTVGLLLRMSF